MAETIPGFDASQSFVIRTVAREAAREAIAELCGKDCPFECEDMDELKTTVYGNGKDGLKSEVVTLKEQVASLVWWNRATIAASLSAIGGLVVSLLLEH